MFSVGRDIFLSIVHLLLSYPSAEIVPAGTAQETSELNVLTTLICIICQLYSGASLLFLNRLGDCTFPIEVHCTDNQTIFDIS